MNRFSQFFYRKSSLLVAILLTIVSFAYLYLVMMKMAEGFAVADESAKSLGTSFGFTVEDVTTYFAQRTPEMLAKYRSFNLLADNGFAFVYGMMYVIWVSYLFLPFANRVKWINLLPLLVIFFDWTENTLLNGLIDSFIFTGSVSAEAVQITSLFCVMKWYATLLTFGLILIGIGVRIRHTIRKKGN